MSYILSPTSNAYISSVSADDYVTSPIVTSINTTYSKPLIGTYLSINYDPEVRERVVAFVHKKLHGSWDLPNKNAITSKFVEKILDKFVERTHYNWVDIPHKKDELIKVFKHELKKQHTTQAGGGGYPYPFVPNMMGPQRMNVMRNSPLNNPPIPGENEPPTVAVASPGSPFIGLIRPPGIMPPQYFRDAANTLPVQGPSIVLSDPVSMLPSNGVLNRVTVSSQPSFQPPFQPPFQPSLQTMINQQLYPGIQQQRPAQFQNPFNPSMTIMTQPAYTFGTISPPLRNVIVRTYPQAATYPDATSVFIALSAIAAARGKTIFEVIEEIGKAAREATSSQPPN